MRSELKTTKRILQLKNKLIKKGAVCRPRNYHPTMKKLHHKNHHKRLKINYLIDLYGHTKLMNEVWQLLIKVITLLHSRPKSQFSVFCHNLSESAFSSFS